MRHNKGTFIVKVDDCQNESWQGRVVWADENKTEHFRSALELFKLMDNAIKNNEMSSKKDQGTA
ncbi:hypothetical protein [Butyrivibrio sp. VCB2006]|uniref:hypothetical protein n=1 Tax=Butyrivibrio sp. VCB2006 TaxID=1280679 RepID=UPI0003F9ED8A|nr:hypothetical protein [Butyrivibrio sp. VCB2006]